MAHVDQGFEIEFSIQLVRMNLAITFDSEISFIVKRGTQKIESK